MADIDRAVLGREDDAALNDVLHFADIAWPAVVQHRVEGAASKAGDVAAAALAVLAQHMVKENGQVLAALAQPRHTDRKHVQAKVQVLPEATGADERILI
ncbi:hypothetical protein [Paraburkholderia domus]|uniref:hypothetical protein n=1 Tax=Paraburkholderia domus TaxID=2793075 RepID=UPI001911ED6C|nr:hypothetical protein [Paraburkholderia domus]MBK5065694.1 hypothetical protein [Burkholderia sp. R-70199]CAE6961827.1 hypothetical protein R70199_07377 [Paraburkholderia domus]